MSEINLTCLLRIKLSSLHQLIKRQSCHDVETSQLICSANQLTGFFMIATLAFNELKAFSEQLYLKAVKIYATVRKTSD